jgi:hypothetical protein
MVGLRSENYGIFLAQLTNYLLLSLSNKREDYREKFIDELKKYSFAPRKKGNPMNEGCIRELEDISCLDLNNPEHLAKLLKEGLHLMYQKETSKKVLEILLKNL